mmetsp:Transcript_27830/g.70053  ORF Transcript_27830/g.70053 Transcript_27830/m.70053 type:complete len:228 (-) Transcript_27830:751-1434(-)
MVGGETAAAKVNYLDLTPGVALDQNVLGLKVAVNEPQPVDELHCLQTLLRTRAQPPECEVARVGRLPVELAGFVKVVAQKLAHDKQVLLVIEEVEEAQHRLQLQRVRVVEELQEFDLVHGLVKEVLVVFDDLDANHAVRLHVVALHRLGKGRAPQVLHQLVPAGDDAIDAHGELLFFLEARAVFAKDHLKVEKIEQLQVSRPLLQWVQVVLNLHTRALAPLLRLPLV